MEEESGNDIPEADDSEDTSDDDISPPPVIGSTVTNAERFCKVLNKKNVVMEAIGGKPVDNDESDKDVKAGLKNTAAGNISPLGVPVGFNNFYQRSENVGI